MAITVQCGACAKRFQAPEQYAGKKAKCPACSGPITIPTASAAAPAVHPTAKGILVEAAAKHTGVPPLPSPRQPAETDGYNIASIPVQATPPGPAETKCPSCAAAMRPGAVLCVACGYDTRKGQKVSGAPTPRPGLPEDLQADDQVSPSSRPRSFIVGFVLCSLGALLGAGIWFLIAMLTGYEIGWVAWGVGVLAGLGMMIGYGGDNDLAGITAAFVACAGIFAAKWLIYEFVLLAMFANFADEMRQIAADTAVAAADESDAEDTDTETDPGASAAEATPPPSEPTPAGNVAETAMEDLGPALEEALAEFEPPGFFASCFGIVDGVFILIAFFTAYKFGSGRGSD